jgi:hypothetical protein
MVKLISGTLAALLLTTPGPDQDKHPKAPAAGHGITLEFKMLDHDGDGKVSRDEFMDAFARLDRNHDGILTTDELPSRAGGEAKARPAKAKPAKSKRKH